MSTYYLLSDGATTVVTYPYSIGELRRDNPTISFPANPTNPELAVYNVFPVADSTVPTFNPLTEDLVEGTPTTADAGATWTRAWSVVAASAQEILDRTAAAEASVAEQAKYRLQDTEQYYVDAMIAGKGFTAAMDAYIAQLEDPTTLNNYPLPQEADWPTLPGTIIDVSNDNLPVDIYTKAQVDALAGGGGGGTPDWQDLEFVFTSGAQTLTGGATWASLPFTYKEVMLVATDTSVNPPLVSTSVFAATVFLSGAFSLSTGNSAITVTIADNQTGNYTLSMGGSDTLEIKAR